MKLSREWLGEYTTIGAPDKEYCDAMTLSGSKVEGWEVTGSEISRVVVGRVISMERHTNSDHMWVCKIDVGGERELQIVTGAQNVNIGDLVPVALDGSTLPGGKEIRTGKLRGELSEGMLCSLGELGLEQRDFPYAIEDGIFILEEDCVPGDDIREVCGLNDSVVEFEITNNRPDCLSVRGLARESACTFHTPLTFAEPTVTAGHGDIHEKLSVEIKDAELCPRYTARMVKNIKIAPSPKWMRRRLRASGVRPINNIVDITNYVMLEYGQPMHAFDYACLHDGKIIVRRAEEGESLRTLDGNDHALTPGMLVIADPEGPVALAGVMGGANSEITDETTTIVFESANFLGHSIRKTAIALGMRTDASGRFEKGLDLFATVPAVDRACELVEMLGAGEVFDGTIDVLAKEPETTFIELDDKRINALLGTDIPREFMTDTLTSLGFELNGNTLTAPSWRGDCTMLADIAEECARFWGYDKIEATDIRGAATQGGYSEKTLFVRKLGTACRAMGYTEVVTYSFVSPSSLDKIKVPADSPLRDNYRILNPLGEDTSVMRTTALPSMLGAAATWKRSSMKWRPCTRSSPARCWPTSAPCSRSALTAAMWTSSRSRARWRRCCAPPARRTCASPPTRRPPRSIPAAAPRCGRAIRASARSARSTPTCALPTGSTARHTAPRSTSCCCTISRVRSRSIRRCRASRPSRATLPSCATLLFPSAS